MKRHIFFQVYHKISSPVYGIVYRIGTLQYFENYCYIFEYLQEMLNLEEKMSHLGNLIRHLQIFTSHTYNGDEIL